MYYQFDYGTLVSNFLSTLFFYLGIPLIICGIVFAKKSKVRYKRIIIINAVIMFVIFSIIHYFSGSGIANPVAAVLWSFVASSICKKTFSMKLVECPACGRQFAGDFCTYCGAKLNEEPLTASEKNAKALEQANCIIRLDLNQIKTEWTTFEIYIDDTPHFISYKKDTCFNLPLSNHQVSYKHRLSKIPVLNFAIGENEVVRIVCSLVDKNHITAAVTDRSPKAAEPETSASSETI